MQGAEALLPQLEQIVEVENGLWQPANALDSCMPEALISRNRVKEWSCDCGQAAEEPCQHVATVLLRRLEWLKAEQAAKKKKPARMNIRQLLDQIDHADLTAFVRSYARSNQRFNVALKAHFADRIETASSKEKYESLLVAAHRSAKGRSQYMRASRVKVFLKMSGQMIPQSEDLIASGSFKEAFEMLSALLRLVPQWLINADDRQGALSDFVMAAFENMKRLSGEELPPALHEVMFESLILLFEDTSIRSLQLGVRVLHSIQLLIETREQRDRVLSKLKSRIDERGQSAHGKLLLGYYSLLQVDHPDQAADFIRQHYSSPDIRLVAIRSAIKHDQTDFLEELTGSLPNSLHQYSEEQLRELNALLKSDLKSSQQHSVQKSLLYRTGAKEDLEQYLHDFSGDDQSKELHSLIQFFEGQHTYISESILPHLYFKSEQPEKLMAHISSRRSLDLLKEYAVQLFAFDYDQALNCSKETLAGFVQNNVGEDNAEKVKFLIVYLQNNRNRKAAQALYDFLKKRFEHRDIFLSVLKR